MLFSLSANSDPLSDGLVFKLAESRCEFTMDQRAIEICGQALVAFRTLSVKVCRIFLVIRSAATRAPRCFSCSGHFIIVYFEYLGVERVSALVLFHTSWTI